MRELSPAALAAMLSQDNSEVFLECVEIIDSESTIYRFVSSSDNLVHNGNTYIGFPFTIKMPDDTVETLPQISIVFDNLSKDIVQQIRNLSTALTINYFVVMLSEPDTKQAGPFTMKLREASTNFMTITGKAQWEDILNKAFPAHRFVPSIFPGLF